MHKQAGSRGNNAVFHYLSCRCDDHSPRRAQLNGPVILREKKKKYF